MRLKVLFPVSALSVAIFALTLLGHSRGDKKVTLPESVASVAVPVTNYAAQANANLAEETDSSSGTRDELKEESHDEYVSRRTAELMDLAMSEDSSSLSSILAELNNRDADIRGAAIIAAVQFKSANAIPALEDAYSRTDEPEEKVSIRKAIEFLEPAADSR